MNLTTFVALAIGGAEVTVSGYARRPTTLAYAYDGITLCNLASIQWQVATASWGVIDTVLLYDAVAGGTLIATLPTVTPIEIRQYDIARIPASGITGVLVDLPSPYGAGGFGVGKYGARTVLSSKGTGMFGPLGYGNVDGAPGMFTASGYALPSSTGALIPGAFGQMGYGAPVGVPLERVFDQRHVCSPGVWAPGPCSMAA